MEAPHSCSLCRMAVMGSDVLARLFRPTTTISVSACLAPRYSACMFRFGGWMTLKQVLDQQRSNHDRPGSQGHPDKRSQRVLLAQLAKKRSRSEEHTSELQS